MINDFFYWYCNGIYIYIHVIKTKYINLNIFSYRILNTIFFIEYKTKTIPTYKHFILQCISDQKAFYFHIIFVCLF